MSEETEVPVVTSSEDVSVNVKKPRSELQMKALEAARQKALEMRQQKKLQKEVEEQPETAPEVEYVKKTRAKPKTRLKMRLR